jgi:hypothetical protein
MPICLRCNHIEPKRLKPVAIWIFEMIKLLQSWVFSSLLIEHVKVRKELLKSEMNFMI